MAGHSSTLTTRDLTRQDARPVARLMQAIFGELNARAALSEQSTIDLFDTPWLARGRGLVLETSGKLVGYGWARDSEWNGRKLIHIGLFLSPDYRDAASHRPLTQPLLRLAEQLGKRHGRPQALIFYRSIDTIHPPIARSLGFHDLPTSMIGFRHNLRRIPHPRTLDPRPLIPHPRPLDPSTPRTLSLTLRPPSLTIRSARLPEENSLLMSLSSRAFDNPATQGEPVDEQYLNLVTRRPGFLPDQILVAESSGNPVGYVISSKTSILELGVLPQSRGKGIGSAMLSRLLHWCRSQGLESISTAAFSTNRVVTLYWRIGFRPDAFQTYYFFTRTL